MWAKDNLVSLVRICGYLLIKPDVLYATLVNLLALDEICKFTSGAAFVYKLYRNGFLESAAYYVQGVDHPDFYNLLKQNESNRNVKWQVHSYNHYMEFMITYPYPSGMVKFSKVRAAFFWDYYSPPPIDPDDYSECGW